MLWIIIIAVAIAAIFFMRPRRPAPSHPTPERAGDGDWYEDSSGMENASTGVILSYLVSNFLIDSHQYEKWRRLAPEQLKGVLAKDGIMKESEFDSFSQQLLAEEQVQVTQQEFSSMGVARRNDDINGSGNSSGED